MINIEKQIDYWRKLAVEDWDVAIKLVDMDRIQHGMFFLHLSVEKILKGHVCKQTQDLAPKIHNLIDLSALATISLDDEQNKLLSILNSCNIEGRYPEMWKPPPSKESAKDIIEKSQVFFQWLLQTL
jgi:HEPN domain-containing protein